MTQKRPTYNWVPQAIKKYTALYKGRRYWVFLNDPEDPFDGWTNEWKIIVYDFEISAVIAVGNYSKDGSIDGEYMGGQGITFDAADPKGMIASCLSISKWYK